MRRYLSTLVALAGFLLSSCGGEPAPQYELTGRTMGTQFSVIIAGDLPGAQREELQQAIETVLRNVEQAMSTYLVQSDISQFNASPSTGWFRVSPGTCVAVGEALSVSRLTGGAFDITVGPSVNLWGFGPANVRAQPPAESDIDAARQRVGYSRLHADCDQPALRKDSADVYVDLSGYAKGFAVDRVAELLDDHGISGYLVEIGGELRMRGDSGRRELWAVAIEMPTDTGRSIQRIVRLSDAAMATSGDYRNFFEHDGRRYSHTIDPRTGKPTMHNLAAVTVVGNDAALADAMATALLVLGPVDGYEFAVREDIPAYFQLRTDNGFEEQSTPAFRAIEAAGGQGDGRRAAEPGKSVGTSTAIPGQ